MMKQMSCRMSVLRARRTICVLFCSLVLAATAVAQAPAGCFLEPWVANGGDANLTICSSRSIAGCMTALSNASAGGGVAVIGFSLPQACTTSNVEYIVKTADPSALHHYALGLVCHSGDCMPGTMYVQTGALAGPLFTPAGKVLVSKPWIASADGGCTTIPCTLPAGVYGLVVGSDCTATCAILYGDADSGTFYAFDAGNTTLNAPWTFDPVSGLPTLLANLPPIFPVAQANATSGLPKPPTVLIY